MALSFDLILKRVLEYQLYMLPILYPTVHACTPCTLNPDDKRIDVHRYISEITRVSVYKYDIFNILQRY